MKNYYKVLGIKETASGDDIRTRWIELMRKFHPDGKPDGGAGDRRLKEINEAYGVLKHPSKRLEYDLKRAYHRRRRRSHLPRIALALAVLFVLLISGMIYMRKPRVALVSKTTTPLARGTVDVKGDYPSYPEPAGIDKREVPKDLPVSQDQITVETFPPVPKSKPSAPARKHKPHGPTGGKPLIAPPTAKPNTRTFSGKVVSPRSAAHPDSKGKGMNDTNLQTEPKHTKALRPIVKPESPVTPGKPDAQTNLTSNPDGVRNTETLKKPTAEKGPDGRGISVAHVLIAPNTSIEVGGQTAQLKPPSLIATEDEVRQFLARYIDRYTRRDIEGFQTLFSSKAVQNGKDGFDKIRKMYSHFFGQSKELRYNLEETRIEIYQNAVHVKARYKVNQRLKEEKGENLWMGNINWILVKENEGLKIRYLNYKQQHPRK